MRQTRSVVSTGITLLHPPIKAGSFARGVLPREVKGQVKRQVVGRVERVERQMVIPTIDIRSIKRKKKDY